MDTRNALSIASPQDRQFARRAKAAVEDTTAYQNLKHMLTGPIDQMSDLYTVLQGKGDAATEDRIVGRVGEGLLGMGGYTKNGIPHNHPEVVHAYRKALNDAATKEGKRIRTTAREYPDYTNVDIEWLKPDGSVHVMGNRRLEPEGINNVYLSSLDKDTPSGLLPILYPAEGEFVKKYGGEIWSQLDGDKTRPGWLKEHFAAINQGGNKYRSRYPGREDFPLKDGE